MGFSNGGTTLLGLAMKRVAVACIAICSAAPSFSGKVAPNQGGSSDGPVAMDSAGYGNKGAAYSLNYNKSSCLSLSQGKPNSTPSKDSPVGQDNLLWAVNNCEVPIEFAFCTTGNTNDGFNCKPDGSSALAPQVVYQTGQWGLKPHEATPMPSAYGNRIVWYACDWSGKNAPLPLITSYEPPMGTCWSGNQNRSDAANHPPDTKRATKDEAEDLFSSALGKSKDELKDEQEKKRESIQEAGDAALNARQENQLLKAYAEALRGAMTSGIARRSGASFPSGGGAGGITMTCPGGYQLLTTAQGSTCLPRCTPGEAKFMSGYQVCY